MFPSLRALAAVAIALCSTPSVAHDFWIEPTSFAPEVGQSVGLRLRVGERLAGEPVAFAPALIKQFVVDDAIERKPVVGRRSGDPAGLMRVLVPGLHIVGYHSHPSSVELTADKFNAYLIEEGLEAIVELRARRNESRASARELYARCAKSLLMSGPPGASQGDRRLGFPLELVAERNPYTLHAGEDLPIRLTYEERPLRGALVVALNSANPSEKLSTRTDHDGRARLQLRPGGMWLIKAVHMVAAPPGADADWSSYWASLTFEMRGP